jgi:hypothetical protein
MMDQLQIFSSEVSRVAREVGTEGILGGQAQISGVDGTWKELTDNGTFPVPRPDFAISEYIGYIKVAKIFRNDTNIIKSMSWHRISQIKSEKLLPLLPLLRTET